MNCQNCGHPKSSHIYEEGSCRPGFICPCDHYVPPKDPRTSIVHENTRPLTPCPNSREIIPHKSMDPQVEELKRDLDYLSEAILDAELALNRAKEIRKKWDL